MPEYSLFDIWIYKYAQGLDILRVGSVQPVSDPIPSLGAGEVGAALGVALPLQTLEL